MGIVTNDEAVLCKTFSCTLSDKALTWFTSLKSSTIDSWHTLEKIYLDKFNTAGTIPKTRGDLANIKQRDDKSLLSFLERSKKMYDEIEGISQDKVITCFEGRFRSKMVYTELQLRKLENIGEMFNVAQKVALAEGSALESTYKRKDKPLDFHRDSHQNFLARKGKNRARKIETFTPLNVLKESLVSVIKDKFGVQDPTPMRPQTLSTTDKSKFCGFHRDYKHTIENFIQLKRAIELLIREGYLKEYISNTQQQKDKGERVINMITPKISSVKKIKKWIYYLNKSYLIHEYEHVKCEVISFSHEELVHNEEAKITPIVLEVRMTREGIDKCMVKRVLIDTRAMKNILYFKYFKEMGMNDSHLKPSTMVLEGFITHKISVKGTVKMQVTLGTDEKVRIEEIKFYVVDINSLYNAILGTPFHAAFDLFISMSHQQVKFNTMRGVRFVRSSPRSLLGHIMKVKRKRDEGQMEAEVSSILARDDLRI